MRIYNLSRGIATTGVEQAIEQNEEMAIVEGRNT
jgi:hypothetical protein